MDQTESVEVMKPLIRILFLLLGFSLIEIILNVEFGDNIYLVLMLSGIGLSLCNYVIIEIKHIWIEEELRDQWKTDIIDCEPVFSKREFLEAIDRSSKNIISPIIWDDLPFNWSPIQKPKSISDFVKWFYWRRFFNREFMEVRK